MDPFITIVVPIRNEARFIRATLDSILRQNYPPERFEIIVADGQSDDGTVSIVEEMAREHPQIRLVENERRRSSAGRNLGFRLGRGDFFLVIDGHCHVENDLLLRSVADCFVRSGADCLGRPQPLDPPGLTSFQKSVALARASWIGHGRTSLIFERYEGYASPVSNGAAYRRDVFDRIGYVDERLDACEDVEFNYRLEKAGMTAYTSPSLTVRYFPRENLRGLLWQMFRYGQGRYRFLQYHPESLQWDSMVPPFFVLGLILLFISGIALAGAPLTGIPVLEIDGTLSFSEIFLVGTFAFCFGCYVLYLALVTGAAIVLSSRHGWEHLRNLIPIFFVIHLGLGWGFLAGAWEIPSVPAAASAEKKGAGEKHPQAGSPLPANDGKVSR